VYPTGSVMKVTPDLAGVADMLTLAASTAFLESRSGVCGWSLFDEA
jgi:hypothetical protein